MNNSLRLFIALELSKEMHQSFSDLIINLKKISLNGVKWVKPENIHLTLKFLGDTPQTKIIHINSALEKAVSNISSFTILSKGTGVFPNLRQPRVFWAGITTPPELLNLQKQIDSELSTLEFEVEKRPFTPHLTLGRVSESANPEIIVKVINALTESDSFEFGSVNIQQITLFQSTLSPGGSIYTPLKRISLQSQA